MDAAPPPAAPLSAATPVAAVLVPAPRLPPSPADAAFSIQTLDLTAAPAPRLDEALTATPGVSLFRRVSSLGANPTVQGLSLRAIAPSGAGRALVTLDGVPQNDPFGGWVIWSGLPAVSLDAAQLVRGGGAGPYGAGALTGTVALSERGAASGLLAADAFYGELGDAGASAAVGAVNGRFAALGFAAAEQSRGWVPVREGRGAADDKLTLDSRSAGLRLQADLGEVSVAGRVAAYREARDSGLAGAASRSEGASASLTAAHAPKDALGWRVQAWARTSDLYNSSVAVQEGRVGTTPASEQYSTPATGLGLNAALRREGDWGLWEVGADVRYAEGESRERFRYMGGAYTRQRFAGGETLVLGAYGEAARVAGPWLLTGGVRVDRWSASDGFRRELDIATGAPTLDETDPDRDGVVWTGRAGARRALGETGFVRAAAYSSFRPPTLNELHRPFRVGNDITEANAALEPERLAGIEAGLGGEVAGARLEATVFANRLSDPITNVTIGVGPGTFPRAGFVPAGGVLRQRQNAGRIDAVGIEGSAERRFGDLNLRAAIGYTEAEVDGGSAAPQLTGLRPAQAPRLSATLDADWTRGPFALAAQVRHEGMRFEDDQNLRRLAAATTLDARAGWTFASGVELYVAADNLTGADVETGATALGVLSYGPPRAVRLGVSYKR